MSEEAARLDQWLWAVRIFKTRSLASDVVSGKSVRITRHGQTQRTSKPGFKVRVGDRVAVMRARELIVAEVLDLPERRLSAPEAALCYSRITDEETS